MNRKDFEKESGRNDVNILRSQLIDVISKREKIQRYLENVVSKERDLKLRIHIQTNEY